METNNKHTAGELWIDDNGFIAIGTDDNYMIFADLDCSDADIEEREANKDRIVKCWNSHNKLLEALRICSKLFDAIVEQMPDSPLVSHIGFQMTRGTINGAITEATQ